MNTPKKLPALVALAAAGALTLTACGNDESDGHDMGSMNGHSSMGASAGASSGSFDKADVAFASQMVPHHRQAVQMAKMAKTHAKSPAVKRLAAKIEAAQGPEITTMTGWLRQWGQRGHSSMGGMGMGGGSGNGGGGGMDGMPGMMASGAMDRLDQASGAAFDRMFLTMMIAHHQGAVTMARTEQAKGKSPDAIALAKKIEQAQTAEIALMKKMLGA